jgi:hypothetical protein
MKISKTHQKFANLLSNQRALSHPDEFLGPNWRDVLNFWIYLDTLRLKQILILRDLYWKLQPEHRFAQKLAWDVAKEDETVGKIISNCAFGASKIYFFGYATLELIGAHKILEQGKPLTFTSFLLDL